MGHGGLAESAVGLDDEKSTTELPQDLFAKWVANWNKTHKPTIIGAIKKDEIAICDNCTLPVPLENCVWERRIANQKSDDGKDQVIMLLPVCSTCYAEKEAAK